MEDNNHIVMIMGRPNTGKSYSLNTLKDKSKWVYLNVDRKVLPFIHEDGDVPFAINMKVTEPYSILEYIDEVEANPDIEGIIIDTITDLMIMFETQIIYTSADSRAAWGLYQNFYNKVIDRMKSGTKSYIIMAHAASEVGKSSGRMETIIPVKGALVKRGIESDFTTILTTAQMETDDLEDSKNELLSFTKYELEDGIKRVFITRLTKDSLGDKTRSAPSLWKRDQLYIDNDIQQVIDRVKQFYS